MNLIFFELYLCSLCNKEFPKEVNECSLEHCKFCGNTSLEVVPMKIIKDPVFILMNTLLALVLVYAFFNKDENSSGAIAIFAGVTYIFGLVFYLIAVDKRSNYYCKNCRTMLRSVITNVEVGEYESKPENKQIIQSSIPKTHPAKDIIMIVGSVGSVVSAIVILMPK